MALRSLEGDEDGQGIGGGIFFRLMELAPVSKARQIRHIISFPKFLLGNFMSFSRGNKGQLGLKLLLPPPPPIRRILGSVVLMFLEQL